jgi:dihydroorotate dehydrogenase electron transfer subunit
VTGRPAAVAAFGKVIANELVSSAFHRLDVVLDVPFAFLPGQFVMINEPGPRAWTFSRPFSILAGDGDTVALLYRVVGRGTAALAALGPGSPVSVLGPLGEPFPAPAEGQVTVLLGGGVGLPPVFAWWRRWGQPGDAACFGARHAGEVPWGLLGDTWRVSVDDPAGLAAGHRAASGVVTSLVADDAELPDGPRVVTLACGPWPLLRAAAALARRRGWRCWVSLEEHMGCGYGVCKGCVVRVADGGHERNATCCQDGPVFDAERLPGLVGSNLPTCGDGPTGAKGGCA